VLGMLSTFTEWTKVKWTIIFAEGADNESNPRPAQRRRTALKDSRTQRIADFSADRNDPVSQFADIQYGAVCGYVIECHSAEYKCPTSRALAYWVRYCKWLWTCFCTISQCSDIWGWNGYPILECSPHKPSCWTCCDWIQHSELQRGEKQQVVFYHIYLEWILYFIK
jgi:hypothetical protein